MTTSSAVSPESRRHALALACTVIAALTLPAITAAQQQTATMRGRVTDRATGLAVGNAEITLGSQGRSIQSDSSGRYLFAALPPGTVRFVVRAPGYQALHLVVELTEEQNLVRAIELDSTATPSLPAVSVNAPAPVDPRLADFVRRRATGRGQYLTRAEIEKSGATTLQDAVRAMRGVTIECGGGGGCYARMVRAPMRCLPDYVVDGQVDNGFGPTTPIGDIEGLEVYTGPSDVPGEYAGSTAGCGVIVIWTGAAQRPRTP